MPITDLNHYFIRANDLEKTRNFYCTVLDLEPMPRPTFAFPGYWLGTGNKIWVHIGLHGIENADVHYLGSPSHAATDNAGVIDHIAFAATKPEDFRDRLVRADAKWWARTFPQFKLFQIFARDPDGLMLELNFYDMEVMPDWGEDYNNLPPASR